MKKEIIYKRSLVMSYDKDGYVCFSKEVTGGDSNFIDIIQEAWEQEDTYRVVVEFSFNPIIF